VAEAAAVPPVTPATEHTTTAAAAATGEEEGEATGEAAAKGRRRRRRKMVGMGSCWRAPARLQAPRLEPAVQESQNVTQNDVKAAGGGVYDPSKAPRWWEEAVENGRLQCVKAAGGDRNGGEGSGGSGRIVWMRPRGSGKKAEAEDSNDEDRGGSPEGGEEEEAKRRRRGEAVGLMGESRRRRRGRRRRRRRRQKTVQKDAAEGRRRPLDAWRSILLALEPCGNGQAGQ